MHLQTLSSGSRGNATLVRAGEISLLVDAGLVIGELTERLDLARLPVRRLDHVLLSHGHLDHTRSAGILSRRNRELTVHCCERLMGNRAVHRARRLARLPVGRPTELAGRQGADRVGVTAVKIPHDADPTVAFRLEHEGRVAVVLTDMGEPTDLPLLADPHLLVLEFNHDPGLLRDGPYRPKLKQRIAGPGGHLSNQQAADVLGRLCGPRLHTLVLAHLSRTNNRPLLALEAARSALAELGREDVRVLVADQDAIGESLSV